MKTKLLSRRSSLTIFICILICTALGAGIAYADVERSLRDGTHHYKDSQYFHDPLSDQNVFYAQDIYAYHYEDFAHVINTGYTGYNWNPPSHFGNLVVHGETYLNREDYGYWVGKPMDEYGWQTYTIDWHTNTDDYIVYEQWVYGGSGIYAIMYTILHL